MDSGSLVAIGLLLVSSALFVLTAATEFAFSLLPMELPRQHAPGGQLHARLLERLLEHPLRTTGSLYGAQVLLAVVAFVTLTALIAGDLKLSWGAQAAVLTGLLLLLLATPRLLRPVVVRARYRWALTAAPWMYVLVLSSTPVFLLTALPPPWRTSRAIESVLADETRGHLNSQRSLDREIAFLGKQELRMIRDILQLDRTTAREIMTPRVDVVALPVEAPPSQVVRTMLERGHGRIPIYEGSVDHILGIAHARDLLRFMAEAAAPPLRELLRPAPFIPEGKRLKELLQDFQQQRVHIAIVVDEYGGTAGLVTIEDLLEEIVGEIMDEFARDEPEVELVSATEAILNGRASLDTLNDLFAVDLRNEDVDTVGGFVASRLGKIPVAGERVDTDSVRLEVLSTVGRRIKKVRAVKLSAAQVP
ncbi:MAG: HlyC/CorC family transporter [Chloroflexi bacterium]|nr:HlyC/CorC family transporter [Chloroflexota bacterium]